MPIKWRTKIFNFISKNNIGYLDYKDKLIKIYVDSNIVLYRLNSCKKEPKTIQWIEDFIKVNEVFYDIGANIGAYSFVTYINTGGKCKIYSFEPSFSTYTNLCYNIYLNNFQDKIIPLNIALSDSTGADNFKYVNIITGSADHAGINREDKTIKFSNYIFSQKIFKYTLDDVVEKMKLDLPNHLKIDVDGNEFFILTGAEKILKNDSLKTIQLEIDFSYPENERRICEFLEHFKFKIIQKNRHRFNKSIFDYVFKK